MKRRVMVLMHHYLVPPEDVSGHDLMTVQWKTEHDVTTSLRDMGHEIRIVGVKDDLTVIRRAVEDWKPHIAFNMMEHFHELGAFDHNVVSYLELLRVPYTGCNPRGLMLARDKALSKTLLSYHRVPVPDFAVVRVGRKVRRPKRMSFPLIVKSLTQEASIGISQASVVHDDKELTERVGFIHASIGTDAILERYIEGRELYVGIIGNQRLQVLPVWELSFAKMPEDAYHIATERVKWSYKYQQKYGIKQGQAKLSEDLALRAQHLARRVYRTLDLSGYARIDFRMDESGKLYVLEANPNPQLSYGEEFAESAEKAGLSYGAVLQRIINAGLQWRPERLG
ncbi:MAG: ATP-grasp domain-containing protein [Acidobacteria bacterium]|nr:ATP-grasp domain-containing protein [Acidobacteriota bacterium]